MDSFAKMVPQTATVIRGGQTSMVAATQITIGDLIEVKGGDKIPADVRVITCASFKVRFFYSIPSYISVIKDLLILLLTPS